MQGFEENEISINSNGGTELSKRSIAKMVPEEISKECQVIASRVRDLNQEKVRIYWQHDLAEDPEISHLRNADSRNRFHQFVFVSNWQLQEYVTKLNFPQDDKVCVIENPIDIFPKIEKNFDDDVIRLIYFSTPQRGLDILVPVFETLALTNKKIHLDVFSSFEIYGWPDADKQFEPLYQRIKDHPQMTYHGYADQNTLREYIQKAHILAYPSIWKETSCRVLIESMSAGLICVHPNLAALSETSAGLTSIYQYHDDHNDHAHIFLQYLNHAINIVKTQEAQNYLKFIKVYADTKYNLDKISLQWLSMMDRLIKKYPNIEDRKIIKAPQMFTYRTV